jgi:hypothetical protein
VRVKAKWFTQKAQDEGEGEGYDVFTADVLKLIGDLLKT